MEIRSPIQYGPGGDIHPPSTEISLTHALNKFAPVAIVRPENEAFKSVFSIQV